MSVGICAARVALAGNPSDGYGGTVVSIPVPSISATVTCTPSPTFAVHSPAEDFTTVAQLAASLAEHGPSGIGALVFAALTSLHRHVDLDVAPTRCDVTTTIPRSVGLAGSSAIVIATIRAFVPDLEPDVMASVALDAEVGVLGIAAGLQDRVVQSHGRSMFMDFGASAMRTVGGLAAGTYRPLPHPPGTLFVAAIADAAGASGRVHSLLQDDHGADRPGVRDAMNEIADAGRAAATAMDRGDIDALGAAMDTTFDLRRQMMVLDPRILAMADTARSLGCHVNQTGSGGAIVVLAPNDAVARSSRAALTIEPGTTIVDVI